MACAPGTDEKFYVGTMDGWYLDTKINSTAIAAHWVCFIALAVTTVYLGYESWSSRGPSKKQRFYAGYQEEQNLALFVNFFAMLSYYGKIVADMLGHNFVDVGPFILGFGNYRYADYMLTCPMLVYDLLYQLRAPYRVSLSAIIFAILLSGVIAEIYSEGDPRLRNGAFAWYGFGLFWFLAAYVVVMNIVSKQYKRLADLARDTGAEHSLSVLKFAVFTFSMLWVLFPLVWAICPRGLNWIDDNWTEVAHCVCDIVAKSCYGFALARFRRVYDEELFRMLEQLGHDEDEFERVEMDMRLSNSGERLRRLSHEKWENRSPEDTLVDKKSFMKRAQGKTEPSDKKKIFPVKPGPLPDNPPPSPTATGLPAPAKVPDLEAGEPTREAWATDGAAPVNVVVVGGGAGAEEGVAAAETYGIERMEQQLPGQPSAVPPHVGQVF